MKKIWKEQFDRICSNILAFILLGLLSGFIIGGKSTLENWEWLNYYFGLAGVKVDYSSFGSSLLSEHLAPNTLTLILVFSFFLSAIHRIVFGAIEVRPNEKKGVIYSLVNFGSLLATAWLGILLGISVPATLLEDWRIGLFFLLFSIYPIAFLVQLPFCLMFLYEFRKNEKSNYFEERSKWKIRTRIEGLVILIAAVILFSLNEPYQNIIMLSINYLKSAL